MAKTEIGNNKEKATMRLNDGNEIRTKRRQIDTKEIPSLFVWHTMCVCVCVCNGIKFSKEIDEENWKPQPINRKKKEKTK